MNHDVVDNLQINIFKKLSSEQQIEVKKLQQIAFFNVDENEAAEDFYRSPAANVLAYSDKTLIGWAGIHKTEQDFESKMIVIGGYGICTHPNWQGRGIAKRVSQLAMNYIKEMGCDVAFLSIDTTNIVSIKLHQKNGFVMFPRKFSWTNSKGEIKNDNGAMIAPVNSPSLFDQVLNGQSDLYVGHGYW